MKQTQNKLTHEQQIQHNAESLIIFNQAVDQLFDFEPLEGVIEHLDALFMSHYLSHSVASETTVERERRVVIHTNLKASLYRLYHQYSHTGIVD